ncbi:hypothetical protein BKA93DRAFT_374746 [Sparassis latifolia]
MTRIAEKYKTDSDLSRASMDCRGLEGKMLGVGSFEAVGGKTIGRRYPRRSQHNSVTSSGGRGGSLHRAPNRRYVLSHHDIRPSKTNFSSSSASEDYTDTSEDAALMQQVINAIKCTADSRIIGDKLIRFLLLGVRSIFCLLVLRPHVDAVIASLLDRVLFKSFTSRGRGNV